MNNHPAIYQGPLEAKPWQSFLRHLRLRMECEVAVLAIRPGWIGTPRIVVWENGAADDQAGIDRAIEGSHRRLGDMDPLGKALVHSGDIGILDEAISREELITTDFYRTLMKPYGIEYQLGACFSEPSGWRCGLGLMNGPLKHNFGEPHKGFVKSMLPHLEKSLEVFARLERSESEKEALAQTLDRLTIGTVFLDARGRVVDTNQVARRIVRENNGLSLVNQKLVTRSSQKNVELISLIARALAGREANSRENFVGVLKTESSKGLCVNLLVRAVLPTARCQSDVSPSVVVYLEETSRKHPAPSGRLLAELFGLTTSEAFLASLLASGVTLSDAAIKLGTTEGTVRTNVKRIFAKTGVNRQADLVGLILKSVAALA